MKIYVGRWDLLPEEWEGYNGLSEKTESEIKEEMKREWLSGDQFIGTCTPKEFEETFNQDLTGQFNTKEYWIKIF